MAITRSRCVGPAGSGLKYRASTAWPPAGALVVEATSDDAAATGTSGTKIRPNVTRLARPARQEPVPIVVTVQRADRRRVVPTVSSPWLDTDGTVGSPPAIAGAARCRGVPVVWSRMLGRPVFDYRHEYEFALTPAAMWERMEHLDQFETWWPWLQECRLEGGGLRPGSVLHGVVVPPLPYRMAIRVELTRCEQPGVIDALVGGDLEGEAHLRVRAEGIASRVEVAWTVEMMQRPMRLASRFGRPLLQWGHDRVVEMTVNGFRRRLEAADT